MSEAILRALEGREQIRAALDVIGERVQRGGTPCRCQLGYQGGYEEATVYWHDNCGLWCMLDTKLIENRSWCCFGTTQPTPGGMLSIMCEINSPFEGIRRDIAGVFAKDDGGHVYLAHTGKVGGGRPGIGKSAFWHFYGGKAVETIEWSDGGTSPAVVIGRIDGEHLLISMAGFVRQVEDFKSLAASGKLPAQKITFGPEFKPEFEGNRRAYSPSGQIEARCDHGAVVNRLYDELKSTGREVANGRPDLYVLGDAVATHIFEVKTDTSTTSIYQGIGQLMFHGAVDELPPKRILVLPSQPGEATRNILARLDIAVLVFDWEDGLPVFHGLKGVME